MAGWHKATAFFRDGPCKYTKREITFDVQPPEFLTCKGTRYIIQPLPDVPFIDYVVWGGPLDLGGGHVAQQRDVWKAWHRLHRALNHTTRRELVKVRRAGHRIRRAVR